jgi:hypothetical protein
MPLLFTWFFAGIVPHKIAVTGISQMPPRTLASYHDLILPAWLLGAPGITVARPCHIVSQLNGVATMQWRAYQESRFTRATLARNALDKA